MATFEERSKQPGVLCAITFPTPSGDWGTIVWPCWCHKCRKGLPRDRMIVCSDCGNKRCPKASDHELACTNSNEPGQPGSVYA